MHLRTTCSINFPMKARLEIWDDRSSVRSGRVRLSSVMVSVEQFSVFMGTLLFLMTHLLC